MLSRTDAFRRIATPVNPQPSADPAVLSVPVFHVDADQLMAVMDDGGIDWFVMNYGTTSPLFLAFEFRDNVTLDALDTAQCLKRRFEFDADLRKQMTDYALSSGQAFHEFGAAGTVWRTPVDEPAAA